MQAGALDLLHVAGVFVSGDDLLHFAGRDGEAGTGRPDAVTLVVEDGGAVDVAGADEAVGGGSVSQGWLVGIAWVGEARGRMCTWCQRMLCMEVVSWVGSSFGLGRCDDWWVYEWWMDRWMDVPCQDMMDVVCV